LARRDAEHPMHGGPVPQHRLEHPEAHVDQACERAGDDHDQARGVTHGTTLGGRVRSRPANVAPSVRASRPHRPRPVGTRHGHGSLGGGHRRSRDSFDTVTELREILTPGVFEPSLDGAATAAYVYLTFVSESYADLDRPADTSVINAMAGESCGWCANHIQRATRWPAPTCGS